MTKTFFIPNKQSILGEQEILTAKSNLGLGGWFGVAQL